MNAIFSRRLQSCLTRPGAKPGVIRHPNICITPPAVFATHRANTTRFSSCKSTTRKEPNPTRLSPLQRQFWTCRSTWRRAGVNTFRCLVGCTVGDFSALWMLQSYFPELGMSAIMGLSMASGITTSIVLETILLKHGPDRLPWKMAFRTATGMSLVSMLAMEAAENIVDYHLTGGMVALDDPRFWAAALVSVSAGFVAPLPYNYWRLKRWGKSCH